MAGNKKKNIYNCNTYCIDSYIDYDDGSLFMDDTDLF
mgnify:CR=1 FL=1